jgi:hypothetical protein
VDRDPLGDNHHHQKAIQTIQDVGYYALGGPNVSKPCVPLHLQVLDLGDPLPTNLPLRGYPSVGVMVKHRHAPSPQDLVLSLIATGVAPWPVPRRLPAEAAAGA